MARLEILCSTRDVTPGFLPEIIADPPKSKRKKVKTKGSTSKKKAKKASKA